MSETNPWRPIASAPREQHLLVRDASGVEQHSYYGKVSHVPIYGWLDFGSDDPEDVGLLKPEPVEWRRMAEKVDV